MVEYQIVTHSNQAAANFGLNEAPTNSQVSSDEAQKPMLDDLLTEDQEANDVFKRAANVQSITYPIANAGNKISALEIPSSSTAISLATASMFSDGYQAQTLAASQNRLLLVQLFLKEDEYNRELRLRYDLALRAQARQVHTLQHIGFTPSFDLSAFMNWERLAASFVHFEGPLATNSKLYLDTNTASNHQLLNLPAPGQNDFKPTIENLSKAAAHTSNILVNALEGQLSPTEFRQVVAFLMSANGEYRCRDNLPTHDKVLAARAFNHANSEIIDHKMQPTGWAKLKLNIPQLFIQRARSQKYLYCYLIKDDIIHKVAITLLRDKLPIRILADEVFYVQVKLQEPLPQGLEVVREASAVFDHIGKKAEYALTKRPDCIFVPLQNLLLYPPTRQFVITRVCRERKASGKEFLNMRQDEKRHQINSATALNTPPLAHQKPYTDFDYNQTQQGDCPAALKWLFKSPSLDHFEKQQRAMTMQQAPSFDFCSSFQSNVNRTQCISDVSTALRAELAKEGVEMTISTEINVRRTCTVQAVTDFYRNKITEAQQNGASDLRIQDLNYESVEAKKKARKNKIRDEFECKFSIPQMDQEILLTAESALRMPFYSDLTDNRLSYDSTRLLIQNELPVLENVAQNHPFPNHPAYAINCLLGQPLIKNAWQVVVMTTSKSRPYAQNLYRNFKNGMYSYLPFVQLESAGTTQILDSWSADDLNSSVIFQRVDGFEIQLKMHHTATFYEPFLLQMLADQDYFPVLMAYILRSNSCILKIESLELFSQGFQKAKQPTTYERLIVVKYIHSTCTFHFNDQGKGPWQQLSSQLLKDYFQAADMIYVYEMHDTGKRVKNPLPNIQTIKQMSEPDNSASPFWNWASDDQSWLKTNMPQLSTMSMSRSDSETSIQAQRQEVLSIEQLQQEARSTMQLMYDHQAWMCPSPQHEAEFASRREAVWHDMMQVWDKLGEELGQRALQSYFNTVIVQNSDRIQINQFVNEEEDQQSQSAEEAQGLEEAIVEEEEVKNDDEAMEDEAGEGMEVDNDQALIVDPPHQSQHSSHSSQQASQSQRADVVVQPIAAANNVQVMHVQVPGIPNLAELAQQLTQSITQQSLRLQQSRLNNSQQNNDTT